MLTGICMMILCLNYTMTFPDEQNEFKLNFKFDQNHIRTFLLLAMDYGKKNWKLPLPHP